SPALARGCSTAGQAPSRNSGLPTGRPGRRRCASWSRTRTIPCSSAPGTASTCPDGATGSRKYRHTSCHAAYDGRMDTQEKIAALNELLEAERAGVEVGAMLKQTLPKGYFRNHLVKIEADEAVSCAVLERGIRALGGQASKGQNDFAQEVAAL